MRCGLRTLPSTLSMPGHRYVSPRPQPKHRLNLSEPRGTASASSSMNRVTIRSKNFELYCGIRSPTETSPRYWPRPWAYYSRRCASRRFATAPHHARESRAIAVRARPRPDSKTPSGNPAVAHASLLLATSRLPSGGRSGHAIAAAAPTRHAKDGAVDLGSSSNSITRFHGHIVSVTTSPMSPCDAEPTINTKPSWTLVRGSWPGVAGHEDRGSSSIELDSNLA
jgi:hypothetical protein